MARTQASGHQGCHAAFEPNQASKRAEQLYEWACQDYVEGDLGEAMRQVVGTLQIRPDYPEAVRLKEYILMQTDIRAFEELPRNIKAEAEAMVAQDQD